MIRSASITTPGVNPFYFDGHQLGYATYSDTSHYFVRELASGATTQLDLDGQGRPAQLWLDDAPAASDGLAHFAFTGFNPEGGEAGIQVFVRDRAAAATSLVSVALSGRPGNGESRAAAISAAGRYVAFHSRATDLVAGDTNGHDDVFVRDRLTSTTTRVSVGSGGSESNASSTSAAISADGQVVAFASDATNLVEGDRNAATDIFLHNRVTGETTRVSVPSGGAEAHGGSFEPVFLGPRLLGFSSNATDLVPGDTNRHFDYFVRELEPGRTKLAAVGPGRPSQGQASYPLAFSADGRWVAFPSIGDQHVPGDTNRRADAFVFGPLPQPWTLPEQGPATTTPRARAPARSRARSRRRPRGRVAPYDFDADGRQDLTVGMPRFQPHGAPDAGAVVVLRGTRSGPSAARRVVISRDTAGVPGVPFGDDGFGMSLASADFDGDRHADLATAVPGDRSVYVLAGSARGLTGSRVRQVRLGGGRAPPDGFSPIDSVLAARDLDGDGFGDLVVGPRPLRLYRGRATGLSRRPTRTLKAPKGARAGFGAVLALGDVDGDGHIDVIEGAPGNAEDLDDGSVPGHMTFCRGTPSGPKSCRRLLGGRPGPASLAVSDVTGDGRADVVAGVPVTRFHIEGSNPPGAVLLFPGGRRGPGAPMTITPASAGVPGVRRRDDSFGASVAAAKLDGDRFADIVVGGAGSIRAQGRAWIIRGGPLGHATSDNRVVDEAAPGIPGRTARLNGFGMAASVLDTDGRGRPEVILGVPGRRNGDRGAGALTVLRVARDKLKFTRARSHSLRSLRLNAPEAPDALLTTPGFGGVLGRPGASSSTGVMFF